LAQQLIINADDFGLTAGVSRGILEAHHKGVVTSTTVMIGAPDAARAIAEAMESAPKLGLGLHLTMSGQVSPVLPAAQIPSLVTDTGSGFFHPLGEWKKRYDQLDHDEIRRELTAQVDRFIALAGKPPDHLDGHHHAVYLHPTGLRTLFDLAAQYQIPVRNLGADPAVGSLGSVLRNQLNGVPSAARDAGVEAIKAVLQAGPIPVWPTRFEADFYDKNATLGDLLLMLTNLPEGVTELMCHPGYPDESLLSDYNTKRQSEISTLCHASVKELIKAHGIELVTFSVLN
jgi:predicted glycoside hydrolase/deacetylase ChbG (UPF0249 family)